MKTWIENSLSPMAAMRLLKDALKRRLTPAEFATGKSATLPIPKSLRDSIATAYGECTPRNVAGLIAAAMIAKDSPVSIATPTHSPDRRGLLQSKLSEQIATAIANKQITLAEASTGIGKSRVIATNALNLLREDPDAVVWIAVPTMQTLAHMLREIRLVMRDTDETPVPLFGSQQLFDPIRAAELINPDDSSQKLLDWIIDNAPPVSAHTKTIAESFESSVGFFMDDAVALYPAFPARECALRHLNEGCTASDAMRNMKQVGFKSRLVVTTHAMLSILNWNTPDRLPFHHLFVDEAHEIEPIAAKTLGADFAIMGFLSELKRGNFRGKKKAMSTAVELARMLQNCGLDDGIVRESHSELITAIAQAVRILTKLIRAKGASASLKDYLRDFERILDAIENNRQVFLSFSPIRRYPSIQCGTRSLRHFFTRLWERCRSATLLSGTLTTQANNYSYFLRILNIPTERSKCIAPVIAPWIAESTTVHIPCDNSIHALQYPGSDLHDNYSAWINRVSEHVDHITSQAVGGTLVLVNSFADLKALRARLKPKHGSRIIDSGPIQVTKEAFIQAYHANQKPIWIATGAAWTGLDLRDSNCDPEADKLLSDLVIARIPFGLAKHSTHLFRKHTAKKGFGFTFEQNEAVLRMKQGIGRLIRQDNTQKNLWILEGRAFGDQATHASRLVVQSVLAPYSNTKRYSLENEPACASA